MSKVSSTSNYPTYSGGQVSLNGSSVASANYADGVLNSNYTMTPAQKALYDYSQNALATLVPQLNVFSPDVQSNLQSQLDAYTNQGINTINSVYTPMIQNLENDIASRFGNLDNSIFMDNLGSIENKRSQAISSFAQDVLAKQSDLEDDELNRRYNYVDLLNNLQNQQNTTALNYINSALGGSSSANSYNSNLYNSLYKQYVQGLSGSNGLTSLLANALGMTGASYL